VHSDQDHSEENQFTLIRNMISTPWLRLCSWGELIRWSELCSLLAGETCAMHPNLDYVQEQERVSCHWSGLCSRRMRESLSGLCLWTGKSQLSLIMIVFSELGRPVQCTLIGIMFRSRKESVVFDQDCVLWAGENSEL
jgi:hypothetical protein